MKLNCVWCGREFERYDKPRKKNHRISKRPSTAKTCSKICSKAQNRLMNTHAYRTGKIPAV